MPGQNLTIGEMIDAMTAVVGPEPAKLITYDPQPEVWEIAEKVGSSRSKRKKRARFGLVSDGSFEDNIRFYIEDNQPYHNA
ncbi:MAG: hypothetical protein ACFHHU_12760 [Porticoccaceae bacterium]